VAGYVEKAKEFLEEAKRYLSERWETKEKSPLCPPFIKGGE
jgi:hypothetical protein